MNLTLCIWQGSTACVGEIFQGLESNHDALVGGFNPYMESMFARVGSLIMNYSQIGSSDLKMIPVRDKKNIWPQPIGVTDIILINPHSKAKFYQYSIEFAISASCWFFPTHLKNMLVKMEHFPKDRGENSNCLSCHHLVFKGMDKGIALFLVTLRVLLCIIVCGKNNFVVSSRNGLH